MPIILLTLLGLVGTMIAVALFANVKASQRIVTLDEEYEMAQDVSAESAILKELSPISKDDVTDLERETVEIIGSSTKELKYLTAIDVELPFRLDANESSRSPLDAVHLHCWRDSTETVLVSATLTPSVRLVVGEEIPDEPQSWTVSEVFAITQTMSDADRFVVTTNAAWKVVGLEDAVSFSEDGEIKQYAGNILQRHRDQLADREISADDRLTFEASDCLPVLQSYFDTSALQYILRGGRTSQEMVVDFRNRFGEPSLQFDMRYIVANQLGRRNAYSRQVDQFVLQQYVEHLRSSGGEARSLTPKDTLILHPLSCPIRLRTQMRHDESGPSAELDNPDDLTEIIEQVAKDGNSVRQELGNLTTQVSSDRRFKKLFEMTEPFSAIIFTINRSSNSEEAGSSESHE